MDYLSLLLSQFSSHFLIMFFCFLAFSCLWAVLVSFRSYSYNYLSRFDSYKAILSLYLMSDCDPLINKITSLYNFRLDPCRSYQREPPSKRQPSYCCLTFIFHFGILGSIFSQLSALFALGGAFALRQPYLNWTYPMKK